jgi:plastocyanin
LAAAAAITGFYVASTASEDVPEAITSIPAAPTVDVAASSPVPNAPTQEPIPPGALVIQMTEFRFDPPSLRVPAGVSIIVAAENTGRVNHSFSMVDPKVDTGSLPPGRRWVVTFTAPSQRGIYRFLCFEEDHEEQGMVGELIVE